MNFVHFPFFIFPFIFFGIMVMLIIVCNRKRSAYMYNQHTPMTILGKRFVNGEITSDEYQQMKEVLKEK
ncbi:SHOCT domain-containing protein [Ornithinibacillus salinisoli]|uniref:SHOCT domain-containing protein n=1 Tax=Ornithinibacillus salinisoli TaxID=1848459 RepID=A0ABW4W0N3_9BACI